MYLMICIPKCSFLFICHDGAKNEHFGINIIGYTTEHPYTCNNHFTSVGKLILGTKPSNRAVKIGIRPSEMFWNDSEVFEI